MLVGASRWTFSARVKALPFAQDLVFTGKSYYAVDRFSRIFTAQRDVWDAVSNNNFPSVRPLMRLERRSTTSLKQACFLHSQSGDAQHSHRCLS